MIVAQCLCRKSNIEEKGTEMKRSGGQGKVSWRGGNGEKKRGVGIIKKRGRRLGGGGEKRGASFTSQVGAQ